MVHNTTFQMVVPWEIMAIVRPTDLGEVGSAAWMSSVDPNMKAHIYITPNPYIELQPHLDIPWRS